MIRRTALSVLVVLTVLAASLAPATAVTYHYVGTLGRNLDDKLINLYQNPRDAEKHDGWCYVPGNPDNRGRAWSCTVDKPRGDLFRYDFPIIAENMTFYFDGRTHRAKRRAPYSGYRPYCVPNVYPRSPSGFLKHYSCAYWVPL
ncbi:hypothetical protein [Lentzea sp. HUAS12]|uniref:hypothetical protein n=1 Tax=Lentzea sp. HUAS12 TaxID=2951806 RepID=UPI0020A165BC|nr:hypothetical protein [Lentzea sp. HUAS12]USX56263.1 hypothetical protein ND450_19820 [Lentzea sp. HUAS12]